MVEERADFTSSVRVLAFETFQKDSIHSTGEDRGQRECGDDMNPGHRWRSGLEETLVD